MTILRIALAAAFAAHLALPAFAQMQSGAAGSVTAGSAASGAAGAAAGSANAPSGATLQAAPSVTLGNSGIHPTVIAPTANTTARGAARAETSAASEGLTLPVAGPVTAAAMARGALRDAPSSVVTPLSRAAAAQGTGARETVSAAAKAAETGVLQRLGRRARSMAAALGVGLMVTLGVLGNAQPVIAQQPRVPAPVVQLQKGQLPAPLLRMAALGAEQAQTGEVLRAPSVSDAVGRWNGQNLIVVGNVGLDQAAQENLAGWMKANGKHFVIVLVADPTNEQYVDANGVTRYGEDAVDAATGHGLARKGAFQAWKNGSLDEPDGAIITFMVGRAYLYYASDALDTRNAGNNSWQGDLLDVVRAPIRKTGDIALGVRSLVTEVNARMDTAIRNETTSAEAVVADAKAKIAEARAAYAQFAKEHPAAARQLGRPDFDGAAKKIKDAERFVAAKKAGQASQTAGAVSRDMGATLSSIRGYESTAATAKTSIQGAEQAITDLADASASFRDAHRNASGELGRPDTDGLTRQVEGAKKSLAEGDVAGAASAAEAAATKARDLTAAIAAYPGFAAELAAQQAALAQQQGRDYAHTAKGSLDRAAEGVGEAARLYEDAQPGFQEKLNAAKDEIRAARETIDREGAAAERNNKFLLALLGIFTLGIGTGLYFGRRKVNVLKAAANAELTKLRTGLDTALNTMNGKLAQKLSFGRTYAGKPGATGRLADQAINDVDGMPSLEMLWLKADGILKDIMASAETKNPFKRFWYAFNPGIRIPLIGSFPSIYQTQLDRLKQPVEFKRAEFGEKTEWTEDATIGSEGEKGNTLSRSFEQLIKDYDFRVNRAIAALEKIEQSVLDVGPALEGAAKTVAAANGLKKGVDEAGSSDGLFLIPAVFSVLLAAAANAIETAKQQMEGDPVGAKEGSGAEAVRMAGEATKIAEWVVAVREGDLKTIYAAQKALAAAGVATQKWLDDKLVEFSGRADALAQKSVEGTIVDKLDRLKADTAALAAQAKDAAAIEADRQKAVRESIEKAITTIADARRAIATGVNEARKEAGVESKLSADEMLKEPKHNPDDDVKAARKAADDAKAALGRGENEAARTFVAHVRRESGEALAIVNEAKAAIDGRVKNTAALGERTKALNGMVKGAQEQLERISSTYADSVLKLNAGDPTHPSGNNGTIADNIEEAKTALKGAAEKLTRSVKAFVDGEVITAATLLSQIAAHQAFADHRFKEIDDKEKRLTKAVADNKAAVRDLQTRQSTNDRDIRQDRKVMEPTLRLFDDAVRLTAQAKTTSEAAKGDPFKAHEAITKAQTEWARVEQGAASDRQAFARAESAVRAAEGQYRDAVEAGNQAKNDPIPDNDKLEQAYRQLRDVYNDLGELGKRLDVGHANWPEIQSAADRLASVAANIAADVRRQIAAGEEAVGWLNRAHSDVGAARSWRGDYGVGIPANHGYDELNNAQRALDQGDYANATAWAQAASREAQQAVAWANGEVARRHQAELDRIAEERRREQERQDRERQERERQEQMERDRQREREREDMNTGNSRGDGGGHMDTGNSRGEA
ncbi:MAG: hypothetical protein HY553_08025 [Elusimicrobia bacterium]|nr:hypothetical protein [Elusimicrobiota bacterium]